MCGGREAGLMDREVERVGHTHGERAREERAGAFSGNCLRRQTHQKDRGPAYGIEQRLREKVGLILTRSMDHEQPLAAAA